MKRHLPFAFFIVLVAIFFIACKKNYLLTQRSTGNPNNPVNNPVSRSDVSVQLTPWGSLSEARKDIAVASAGNKIVFAGGEVTPGVVSSTVDIYDKTSNSWTTANLSQGRSKIATAVLGKLIFFAGGVTHTSPGFHSSVVDIYNTENGTWTQTKLTGEVFAPLTGAAAGNKVVFGSGVVSHIYNVTTNSWSASSLSSRPGEGTESSSVGGIAAVTVDEKIYFAGGEGNWEVHNAIDIFNASTDTWSLSKLKESKGKAAGIAVNKTIYWAGGDALSGHEYVLSDKVEVSDLNTGTTRIDTLFQGNASFSAVQKADYIIFFTGRGAFKDRFDIYNVATKKWLIGIMPEEIENAAIITVDNVVYVAGGKVNGFLSKQVRILQF